MRVLTKLCALFMLTIGGSSMAADGSSGCGPAWYIFKENTIVSSSLRLITNGIFSPTATLGMTFGTSNCSKHGLVDGSKRSLHFAANSYDLLRQDMARGNGMHLDAYLATFGCNVLARQNLAGQLQAEYQRELFLTRQAEAIVETTATLIDASPALTASCS